MSIIHFEMFKVQKVFKMASRSRSHQQGGVRQTKVTDYFPTGKRDCSRKRTKSNKLYSEVDEDNEVSVSKVF